MDDVTLITRPRRFGKTLAMSMVEAFFSVGYAGRGEELFGGLRIWEDEKYRGLQGTYPVISLSFASVKETTYQSAQKKLNYVIADLYKSNDFLLDSGILNDVEKAFYRKVSGEMEASMATEALRAMSGYLTCYYDKKVIILLDEYDTPMQEAYVYGYWEELLQFTRSLLNATFKTNPYMERAIMTGITKIGKESMFSDLNNPEVATVTSEKYWNSFGFTEEEVFAALDEFSLSERREEVKRWYDGFVFGGRADIYNPWSIVNYLDKGKTAAYWVNTSSNELVGKLVREGSAALKMVMERLLQGEVFYTSLDEQIVFSQLSQSDEAVWSLLLASGYLTSVHAEMNMERFEMEYGLRLTNQEVRIMFLQLIRGWFGGCRMVGAEGYDGQGE